MKKESFCDNNSVRIPVNEVVGVNVVKSLLILYLGSCSLLTHQTVQRDRLTILLCGPNWFYIVLNLVLNIYSFKLALIPKWGKKGLTDKLSGVYLLNIQWRMEMVSLQCHSMHFMDKLKFLKYRYTYIHIHNFQLNCFNLLYKFIRHVIN